jgi:hypothetical protein
MDRCSNDKTMDRRIKARQGIVPYAGMLANRMTWRGLAELGLAAEEPQEVAAEVKKCW